jgi:putative ABC transport system permease protein
LTWDDLNAIRELPSVHQAVPMLRTTTSLVSDDQNWTTLVQGTTPDFFEIRNWPSSIGRSFTNSDVETQTKVVVLGRTVADELFGVGSDPTSQVIRINNMPFEMIGVLSTKGQTPSGQNHDDSAFVPASTFRTRLSRSLGNFLTGIIIVQAKSPEMVAGAQAEVSALLRDRHQILAGMDDDFSIRNLDETAKAQQSGARTLTTLLSSIAAVSLLVGGIGIMNIMLVSVTERTREIGLRMAVGAKPQQILAQFLVEASSLSMLGGALGVALGTGGALALAAKFDWPVLIQPDLVLIAVSFSALVGIGFGLYPAQRAARLDPVEALRYE